MRKVKLFGKVGEGKFILVDNEDFKWVNQWKWHLSTHGYPTRGEWNKEKKQNAIKRLHRELLGISTGMYIDHINGNTLDNRRKNLRICTHKQNIANQKVQKRSRSGYKGVSYYKNYNKWEAYVCTNKKKYRLGYFSTKEEAALAYNQKAKELFGEYARLNQI